MSTFLVLLAAGAGTYVIRASLLVLLSGRSVPAALADSLSFVGPAAMGALVASSLAGHGSSVPYSTIAACAVGFVVARRTGRATYALVAGFPVLWLLTALAR